MSVVEIHLVEGGYSFARVEDVLRRVSERYAHVLEVPLGRVCAFVTQHPPEVWAVGGVPAAVDGDPSPYFVATVPEDCSSRQRRRLLVEITDILCDVLGATRVRVRGRLVPVAPGDWAIGGVTASAARREEIARSSLV